MLGANFWKLWTSASVSSIGDGVRYIAVPLLAASFTRDPLLLSVVGAAGSLSWLLFAVPFGVLADRGDRRLLMITSHVVRAVATLAFALAVGAGSRSVLLLAAITLLLGAFDVLFELSAQAALPTVVPARQLNRANSHLSTSVMLFDEFAGPVVGAFLFGIMAILPFLVDAVSFAVAAVFVAAIPLSFAAAPEEGPQEKTTLRQDIRQGADWLWRSGIVKWTVLTATALNLVRAATLAILVLYALDGLHAGNIGFALLNVALAVGALLGSTAAGWLGARISDRHVLFGAPILIGADYIYMAAVPHAIAVGVGMAVLGFTMMNWTIVSTSTRQRLTPNRLLGRVTSLARLIAWGSMPAGALLGGLAARAADPRAPFLLGGCLILAASVLVLAFAPKKWEAEESEPASALRRET